MTDTNKELKKIKEGFCSRGHGVPVDKCKICQDMTSAFWFLFDSSIESPMMWDTDSGEFLYKE